MLCYCKKECNFISQNKGFILHARSYVCIISFLTDSPSSSFEMIILHNMIRGENNYNSWYGNIYDRS